MYTNRTTCFINVLLDGWVCYFFSSLCCMCVYFKLQIEYIDKDVKKNYFKNELQTLKARISFDKKTWMNKPSSEQGT